MNEKMMWRHRVADKLSELFPARKHGVMFETYLMESLDAKGLYTVDTFWAQVELLGQPEKRLNENMSGMDDAYGDLDVMRSGRVLAQLSLKSVKAGETITITEKHIEKFRSILDRRWMVFARVDGKGVPTEQVLFVPVADFLPVWERNKEQKDSDPFIRLKYLSRIPTRIVGISNFMVYLNEEARLQGMR